MKAPPITIFFCYAREDEALLGALKTHLEPLHRRGLVSMWHDRDIRAGTQWEREIMQHLDTAQIVLLLVSPDFIKSDYCYSIEMKRALERHGRGEARVIPIILRPVYWREAPFSKLQVLPTNARPVTVWDNLDEAFLNITECIQEILTGKYPSPPWPGSPSFELERPRNHINSQPVPLQRIEPPRPTKYRPLECTVLEQHGFTYKFLIKSSTKEHILEQWGRENILGDKIVLYLDGIAVFQNSLSSISDTYLNLIVQTAFTQKPTRAFACSFVVDGYRLQYSYFWKRLGARTILIEMDGEALFNGSF